MAELTRPLDAPLSHSNEAEHRREIAARANASVTALYPSVATLSRFGTVAAAMSWALNADDRRLLALESVTVNIPGDSPTLQDAIDRIVPGKGDVVITLNIESGHSPATGILVQNGEFGQFQVTSTDAEVTVDASYSDDAIIAASNARAPVLNALFNADGVVPRGYYLIANSAGLVQSGCGVKATTSEGLYVYAGSRAMAVGTIWSGSQGHAARVSRGAVLHASESDFTNCTNATECVYVNRSSVAHIQLSDLSGHTGATVMYAHRCGVINAQTITADNCSGTIALAGRSGRIDLNGSGCASVGGSLCVATGPCDINGSECTVTAAVGNASVAVDCRYGSRIDVRLSSIADFGSIGIFCRDAMVTAESVSLTNSGAVGARAEDGGRINVTNGEVSGSGGNDLVVVTGGIIVASATTTTNGVGSPDAADTNVSTFNAIDSGNGIIWD